MQDMSQPDVPTDTALSAQPARPYGDDDFALGCECADPALQIERWGCDVAEGSSLAH